MTNIRKRLKEIRKEKNINQSQFAEKLNVPQNTVSQWERGIREPNIDMLKKISKTFEVRVDWLIGMDSAETLDENVNQGDCEHVQTVQNCDETDVQDCDKNDNDGDYTCKENIGNIKELFDILFPTSKHTTIKHTTITIDTRTT